ncbi:MAG: hypothetical protein IKP81_12970 [Paludibacteraceae bacterium]|nr:hypothetical protein [Paludibacteraceae bacterium]
MGTALLVLPISTNAQKNNGDLCRKCNGKGVVEHKCPNCNGSGHVKHEEQLTDEQIRLAIAGQTYVGSQVFHDHQREGFRGRGAATISTKREVTLEFPAVNDNTVTVRTNEQTSSNGTLQSHNYIYTYVYEVKDGLLILNNYHEYKVTEQESFLICNYINENYPRRFAKKIK